MEKLINNRFRWMLETNDAISSYQSDFRHYHSTYDQLINIEINICDSFVSHQSTTLVALDIEKAYDMVCRRLRSIIRTMGFQGNFLHFIINFLKLRRIRVRTNSTLSQPITIQNKVPQDSVVSTLFLLAINEVMSLITPTNRLPFPTI